MTKKTATEEVEEMVETRRREMLGGLGGKTTEQRTGQRGASSAVGQRMLELGAEVCAHWTDDEWAAHDQRVRDSLADDQRSAAEEARRERNNFLEREGAGRNELATHLAMLMRGAFRAEPDHRPILTWHGGGVAIVQGHVGRGKTWLGLEWLMRHPSASPGFAMASPLFGISRSSPEGREIANRWRAAGAFVLDDLGTEDMTRDPSAKVSYLEEIVNTFTSGHRSLLVTTNMPRKDIYERYGARIESRLARASWHVLSGSDRRQKP